MTKKTSKPDHLGSSFSSFMDQFVSESDRAAVILGAAQLDLLLAQILDKYLLPFTSSTDDLLEGDSPLATFSARIKACHRLALIDDQLCKLLNTFRRLRNGFAHEVTTASLSAGSARDRVASLAEPFAATPYFQGLVRLVAKAMKREESDMGAVFRAVLALFHIHLLRIYNGLTPITPDRTFNIVDACTRAKPPTDSEAESYPTDVANENAATPS